MNHLGISGGGTKIVGLFGAAEVLIVEKGYKPDVISGISAGAILSVPLALGKYDEIKDLVLNARLSDFFSEAPVSDTGGFKAGAIWKIITGKPYLGKQLNLEKTLSKVVRKEEFEAYKKDSSKPTCIVGTVNFYDASRWYFDLKNDPAITYDLFLKIVNASASLPVFTNGIQIRYNGKDLYLYDGGVRDHCPTAYMLEKHPDYGNKIKKSISIYSRPEEPSLPPDSFKDNNVLDILSRYIDIANIEVSKNDEWQEIRLARENSISLWQIYMPSIMKTVYDTDKGRLRKLYEEARRSALAVYPDKPINQII
ncbi:MAG: hypothetical protein POELPBGB_01324 [Bacteroidia bacterium]|nr:hypothetical protein [Bacteroidia bacterium]